MRTAHSPAYLWFNTPPGFSCTMGMSFFLAASSSPILALRSTPAEVIKTSAGRGSVYAWMPLSTCSEKGRVSCQTVASCSGSALLEHAFSALDLFKVTKVSPNEMY